MERLFIGVAFQVYPKLAKDMVWTFQFEYFSNKTIYLNCSGYRKLHSLYPCI